MQFTRKLAEIVSSLIRHFQNIIIDISGLVIILMLVILIRVFIKLVEVKNDN